MIKVKYLKENDQIHFLVSGHSNSAPKGEDLICAAVSAITIGGLNALKGEYKVTIEEGLIDVESKEKISKEDEKTFDVILTQLRTIEEKYPKFVQIK